MGKKTTKTNLVQAKHADRRKVCSNCFPVLKKSIR